jgi:hypothetical protein
VHGAARAAHVVIEAGVDDGIGSGFILEALSPIAHGGLWSIDGWHPLKRDLRDQVSVAVTDSCRPAGRISRLRAGAASRPLATEVGTLQLLIRDSRPRPSWRRAE